MKKRGQFEISFGMVFSIIIIIATIAFAIYAITKFLLPTVNCIETGLFFDPLKKYLDKAWQADIHKDTFPNKNNQASIPSEIEYICFGDFSQTPESKDREIFTDLRYSANRDHNVFLYPSKKTCSGLSSIKLEHVKTDLFFCIPVKDNKIQIKTSKERFDTLVTIKAE